MSEFERDFSKGNEFELLEKEFDNFLKAENEKLKKNPLHALRQIRKFLIENNSKRREIFRNTKLTKSDCITFSILAKSLAKRNGINVEIGFPKQLRKYFHSFLIYKSGNKSKIFEVVGGSTKSKNPKVLTQKALMRRFKLTRPFIFGHKLKSSHRKRH
jgi:hypothetical protein